MGGPSKTLLRPSDAQERKKLKKVTKMTPKIVPKTVKKGVPKMVIDRHTLRVQVTPKKTIIPPTVETMACWAKLINCLALNHCEND